LVDKVREASEQEKEQVASFGLLIEKCEENDRVSVRKDAYNNAMRHGLKVEKLDR
jgi:hypothetical protein